MLEGSPLRLKEGLSFDIEAVLQCWRDSVMIHKSYGTLQCWKDALQYWSSLRLQRWRAGLQLWRAGLQCWRAPNSHSMLKGGDSMLKGGTSIMEGLRVSMLKGCPFNIDPARQYCSCSIDEPEFFVETNPSMLKGLFPKQISLYGVLAAIIPSSQDLGKLAAGATAVRNPKLSWLLQAALDDSHRRFININVFDPP